MGWWAYGDRLVAGGGELKFSVGDVRIKLGQSSVKDPLIKQIGHYCEEDPWPVKVRV